MPLVHLSSLIKRPLVDPEGEAIGRVQDLIVRVGERPHPPITGAVVRIEGRDLFVPVDKIAGIERGKVCFNGSRLDLRRFERRPGRASARARPAGPPPDQHGRRQAGQGERDRAGPRGRRVAGCRSGPEQPPGPATALARQAESRHPARVASGLGEHRAFRLARALGAAAGSRTASSPACIPAQIADIVEAASHEEGEEIIEAVKADRELEADVFEELDTEHQVEFVRTRSDADAARLLARMAPDDAADLIMELDQERRLPVLGLLPASQQRKVRSLLSYNPETAGGSDEPRLPGAAGAHLRSRTP